MPAPSVHQAEPAVSVIMTALNEGRHLRAAVDSVFAQDYPGPVELVVAVGPSQDFTERLADQLAGSHPCMRVVSNPSGRTPAGLNRAIAASDPATSIVVRTDGHAQLPPDYIRLAVEDLQRTKAANVGGMMVPVGTTPFEEAAARAMSTRIGIGSAPFHTGGAPGPSASVYLGVFRRSVLADTGGFDEKYSRAQDWELNHRIRELGGLVWFDPRLQVEYRPRPNLARVAHQFHQSGLWRWQIIRDYPETVSLRYLAAPVAVVGIGLGALGAVAAAGGLLPAAAGGALAAVPGLYVVVIAVGAVATRRGLSLRASAWYPAVLATMHLSWGTGFLSGAATGLRAAVRTRWLRPHRSGAGSLAGAVDPTGATAR